MDFSGAEGAGRRIWISSGVIDAGRLHITQTRPACELPGGSPKREAALHALRAFIQGESGAAVGLDFPFGLPRPVVAASSWKEFVLAFNERFPSAELLRETCRTLSKRELRRATDRQARAPWAAWNWRLYRQTFYGIGSILAPLVREDRVRVLPMDRPDDRHPVLLEICPASTLRRIGLGGLPYKGGRVQANRAVRSLILGRLMKSRAITVDANPMGRAVADARSDAVDSLLAAAAVYDTVVGTRLVPTGTDHQIEGFVYF